MERNDIRLLGDCVQGNKTRLAFPLGPGRVVPQDAHPYNRTKTFHDRSDMPYANNADGLPTKRFPGAPGDRKQRGKDVLPDRGSVASRRIFPLDTGLCAITRVDVVETNRGGGD